jgi:phage terminase small subunit
VGKPSSKKPSAAADRPLSARERLFCHLLAIPGTSQTQAAMDAGYSKDPASAATQASRLLTRAKVRELRDELVAAQLAKVASKGDDVVAELHHVGMARLSRCLNDDLSVKPLKDWTEHELAGLGKVEVEELFAGRGEERMQVGFLRKLEMKDKKGALDSLAKIHGLLRDEVDLNLKGHAAIAEEVLKRVRAARAKELGGKKE